MVLVGRGRIATRAMSPSQERDGFGGLVVARGRGRGRGDWSVGTPGGIQEITYTVPADKCGLVIGKGKRQLLDFLLSRC
jgi:far upstream element-binding protein